MDFLSGLAIGGVLAIFYMVLVANEQYKKGYKDGQNDQFL